MKLVSEQHQKTIPYKLTSHFTLGLYIPINTYVFQKKKKVKVS